MADGSGAFVTGYQRVAGVNGVLVPGRRAIKLGAGFSLTDVPAASLSGSAGAAGEVTGYTLVEVGGLAADLSLRSLVLGVGYAGQTDLDNYGASLFRGKVTFAGGTSGILLPPVVQPPIAPGDAAKVVIFRAPLASAVTILSITFTSAQILTADDTIFDTCQIRDFSAVGADAGYVEAQSFFTGLTGAQHTGDWAVGVDAFTWTPMGGYVLAAGHRLLAIWDCTNGGGTEIFSGSAWTIVT